MEASRQAPECPGVRVSNDVQKLKVIYNKRKVDFLCLKQVTEARTGRLRRELELLRSHPKDERGSVREIRLCVRMGPTLHFSRLSPMVW